MHRDPLTEQLEQLGLFLVHVPLQDRAASVGGRLCSLGLGQAHAGSLVQVVHAALEGGDASLERATANLETRRGLVGQEAHRPPGKRRAGEHRLNAVVVPRRNRIELVVVTASAAQCQAQEGLTDMVGDVVKEKLPRDSRHGHASVLPWTASQETRGEDRVRVVGK